MPSPAVLTIDVGNSYLKVTLFDTACRHIDHVSAPTPCGEENLAETAEKWWGVTCHCSRVLTGRNPQYQTAVIGATGYMHALVAVDCHGTPIAFPSRPKGGRANLDQMIDSFDVRRIYGITGSRLDVTSVPPTILTWREWSPQLFSKVSMLLPVKDFIRFRLTDQFATDHIDACGTMLYDLRHRRWSRDLLSCCGLDEKKVPRILRCTELAGHLTDRAAERMGLKCGIPVIVGGGDDIEIIGCGAVKETEVCEHVGSTGSFLLPLMRPHTDPACRLELYPAVIDGEWVFGGSCSNVARALNWFLAPTSYGRGSVIHWDEIRRDLGKALLDFPRKVKDGLPLFLPYLAGERAPIWNPELSGAWIGLRTHHCLPDLLLALVEGICYSLRSILDVYDEQGLTVDLISSSGGFNRLGIQALRASVYGKPIRVVRGADPTSFATAALALCSIGELSDPRDAVAWLDFEPEVDPKEDWKAVIEERFSLFGEYTDLLASGPRILASQVS